jgi:CubicO group peptidase (beta-lactamase class C family)
VRQLLQALMPADSSGSSSQTAQQSQARGCIEQQWQQFQQGTAAAEAAATRTCTHDMARLAHRAPVLHTDGVCGTTAVLQGRPSLSRMTQSTQRTRLRCTQALCSQGTKWCWCVPYLQSQAVQHYSAVALIASMYMQQLYAVPLAV